MLTAIFGARTSVYAEEAFGVPQALKVQAIKLGR